MKKWVPFAAAGGVVLALIAAGAVLLSARDVGPLKGLVEEKVFEKTGRHLEIAGDFGLSVSFAPAIRATEVTFENAAWASEPAMLKLAEVEAKIALIPMIFGKIEVRRLVLKDAEVFLESDAKGRKNWEFEPPAPEAKAGAPVEAPVGAPEAVPTAPPSEEKAVAPASRRFELPLVEEIEVENLSLAYRDDASGTVRTARLDKVRGSREGDDAPFALAASGKVNGAPVELEGEFGPGLQNTPVELSGTVSGTKLDVSGAIADPRALAGLDLAFSLAGESLADLDPLLGGELPAAPFAVAGKLTGGAKAYAVDDLHLALAGNEATGRFALDLAGPRPAFDADLAADELDLSAFSKNEEPAAASETKEPGSAGGAPASEDGSAAAGAGKTWIFDEKPLPLAALRSADGMAKLKARRLIAGKITLEDVDLVVALRNGRLSVDQLQGLLAQGRLGGSLSLDAAKEVPALKLDAKLSGADFAALTDKKELGRFVGGKLDARIALSGAGASPRAIASGLNGGLSAHLTGGKELPDWLEFGLGRDLVSALAFWQRGEPPRLNCFVASLAFKNGIGTFDDLLVDTSHATVSGTGTVNLKTETLDLTAVPRPKDASLLSLAFPVKVEGPLRRPAWAVDKKAAALDVAKSLAGNALLGPFGLILPLVDEGTGEEDPCTAALARAEQGGKAPASKEPEAPAAPASPLEELLKGLEGIF